MVAGYLRRRDGHVHVHWGRSIALSTVIDGKGELTAASERVDFHPG